MPINKGYLSARTDKASDEVYTPACAVKPIIKYLEMFDTNATVWCPFDLSSSHYVKEIEKAGFKVIHTHIDEGQNFFTYEPEEEYDVIISNPPFSCKDAILARLDELGKPFAILLPLPALQGQERFKYLKDIQYLGFDKRINYYKDLNMTQTQDGVSFASGYFCKKFLPKDLILEELER